MGFFSGFTRVPKENTCYLNQLSWSALSIVLCMMAKPAPWKIMIMRRMKKVCLLIRDRYLQPYQTHCPGMWITFIPHLPWSDIPISDCLTRTFSCTCLSFFLMWCASLFFIHSVLDFPNADLLSGNSGRLSFQYENVVLIKFLFQVEIRPFFQVQMLLTLSTCCFLGTESADDSSTDESSSSCSKSESFYLTVNLKVIKKLFTLSR